MTANLSKASLIHLERLETLSVFWNPSGYRIERRPAVSVPGAGSPVATDLRCERFRTTLLLDASSDFVDAPAERAADDLSPVSAQEGAAEAASGDAGESRVDPNAWVACLESWSRPVGGATQPPRLLFAWGDFRFRGRIERIQEEWIRFDATGTPTRGWVDLTLRS